MSIPVKEALRALAIEAGQLREADEQMQLARTRHDAALRRFAAVREMATQYLGGMSPYSPNYVNFWPDQAPRGVEYRFVMMAPGEAAVAALKEAGGPQTTIELLHRLSSGGAFTPLRALTAALTRLNNVEQVGEDKYQLKEEEDLANLPFE